MNLRSQITIKSFSWRTLPSHLWTSLSSDARSRARFPHPGQSRPRQKSLLFSVEIWHDSVDSKHHILSCRSRRLMVNSSIPLRPARGAWTALGYVPERMAYWWLLDNSKTDIYSIASMFFFTLLLINNIVQRPPGPVYKSFPRTPHKIPILGFDWLSSAITLVRRYFCFDLCGQG